MSTRRVDYAERLRGMREIVRTRRLFRPPCICEPGDPCDYHAALGMGSVVDRSYTNGDADEDAEAGIRGDDAGFYTDGGA